jgi:hypothetical protein
MGPILMGLWYANGHREFFARRREVARPGLLEEPPPPHRETHTV